MLIFGLEHVEEKVTYSLKCVGLLFVMLMAVVLVILVVEKLSEIESFEDGCTDPVLVVVNLLFKEQNLGELL